MMSMKVSAMFQAAFRVFLLFVLVQPLANAGIGDAAPNWRGLVGADGKRHSLADYNDSKYVVVAFMCNKCPCVRGYEGRFNQFVKDYGPKGVRFVGINSTIGPLENLTEMRNRAAGGKMRFDYLRDSGQAVAKGLQAKCTPHVFILDQQRRVVYSGAFDDNRIASKVTNHHVRDAMDTLLAGRKLAFEKTRTFGCAISYQ